jgi:dTDP-4-dehydrorhamnose reductase
MRVLVTGSEGQLGRALVANLAGDSTVFEADQPVCDISDPASIAAVVREARPSLIFNCAALTNVDGCEDRPMDAFRVNAAAVRSLALLADEADATLIHFSTDFVFDGEASMPYVEDARTRPLSVYGLSKLMGEWFASQARHHYVLRLSSLFGGHNLASHVDRIIDAGMTGGEVRAFTDRFVSPSYVPDVVAAARLLVERGAPAGLYHCASSGYCSWAHLALEIGRALDVELRLVEISVRDVTTRAPRPRFCALSSARIARWVSPMPTWQQAVARHARIRMAGLVAPAAAVEKAVPLAANLKDLQTDGSRS